MFNILVADLQYEKRKSGYDDTDIRLIYTLKMWIAITQMT